MGSTILPPMFTCDPVSGSYVRSSNFGRGLTNGVPNSMNPDGNSRTQVFQLPLNPSTQGPTTPAPGGPGGPAIPGPTTAGPAGPAPPVGGPTTGGGGPAAGGGGPAAGRPTRGPTTAGSGPTAAGPGPATPEGPTTGGGGPAAGRPTRGPTTAGPRIPATPDPREPNPPGGTATGGGGTTTGRPVRGPTTAGPRIPATPDPREPDPPGGTTTGGGGTTTGRPVRGPTTAGPRIPATPDPREPNPPGGTTTGGGGTPTGGGGGTTTGGGGTSTGGLRGRTAIGEKMTPLSSDPREPGSQIGTNAGGYEFSTGGRSNLILSEENAIISLNNLKNSLICDNQTINSLEADRLIENNVPKKIERTIKLDNNYPEDLRNTDRPPEIEVIDGIDEIGSTGNLRSASDFPFLGSVTPRRMGIFDPSYNFFKTNPDQNTCLVENNKYLNIFKKVISADVSYFLELPHGQKKWTEENFHNLTLEKISISLNKDMLTSLNNIHTSGNKKVRKALFLEAIRKHLTTGTMNEFDSSYYLDNYKNQLHDEVVNYSELGENFTTINSVLDIFETKSIKLDYTKNIPPDIFETGSGIENPIAETSGRILENSDIKRVKFLLEDLESEISILQIEGYDDGLKLNNQGTPVQMFSETSNSGDPSVDVTNFDELIDADLRTGDGAGYYFSTLSLDMDEYPFPSVNSLSSIGYLSQDDKYSILNILGKNGEYRLTVSSLLNYHELSDDYNASADIQIMYFAIDFKSINDINSLNSVINTTSATFTKITDSEAIAHSRNYSFNVVRLNFDFRDPIIQYMRDTGSIYFEQDDFNLRAFDTNRTIDGSKIIPRTIPSALIIVPGCGSKHNPFNGNSIIKILETSSITRTINLVPTINIANNYDNKPMLDRSFTTDSIEYNHLGLYERYFLPDTNGEIYTYNPSSELFSKSYYMDGEYTNVQPPSSLRTNSPESKIIKLVNKLTSLPNVAELTWWDIFTRVGVNDLGSLMYTNNSLITNKLTAGYSNNIPISHIVARYNRIISGIPIGSVISDDVVYIENIDRYQNV